LKSITVNPTNRPIRAEIQLASSKSESNRALIINALTGFKGDLHNISAARDTQTMLRLLQATDSVADVLDAGTTMRFLTAYFAVTNQQKTMTGTARMCERPIGILVDALRTLGAKIDYQNKEGYPPLTLNGFEFSGNNQLSIRGDVSSQYISALLMIAPTLPNGLVLTLTGNIGSIPYIEMTLQQMAAFGVDYEADWTNKIIKIPAKIYQPTTYQIESDWSGASYWYSLVAMADDAEVELLGLKENSLQGDSAIAQIMKPLGVKSEFTDRGVKLSKIPAETSLEWDFSNCPDLAQTVAVCCAIKNITLTLTGIESLKIKETDRVAALQTELPKIGGELIEIEKSSKYRVLSPVYKISNSNSHDPRPSTHNSIETYDDHRMAMAFAPVGVLRSIEILEPSVVAKSYPSFWDDLGKVCLLENNK
jgi:3-phosphoshikimate 1-carboxyvinyltransferase